MGEKVMDELIQKLKLFSEEFRYEFESDKYCDFEPIFSAFREEIEGCIGRLEWSIEEELNVKNRYFDEELCAIIKDIEKVVIHND